MGRNRNKKIITADRSLLDSDNLMVSIKLEYKYKEEDIFFSMDYFQAAGWGYYSFKPVVEGDNRPLPYSIASTITKKNLEALTSVKKKKKCKNKADRISIVFSENFFPDKMIEGSVDDFGKSPIVIAIKAFMELKEANVHAMHRKDLDPIMRLFYMVHEMHNWGYEQLRLCTYISPNGGSLRCVLTTKHNCSQRCGSMHTYGHTDDVVTLGNGIAEWITDDMSAKDMCKAFLKIFPDIAKKCRRIDPDYKEWFIMALEECEQGHIMYSVADMEVCLRCGYIMLTGVNGRGLPYPPKGYSTEPFCAY